VADPFFGVQAHQVSKRGAHLELHQICAERALLDIRSFDEG
jgi:hypothetical protein